MDKNKMLLVMVSCEDAAQAERIGRELLKEVCRMYTNHWASFILLSLAAAKTTYQYSRRKHTSYQNTGE